jgi:hypothetical protein
MASAGDMPIRISVGFQKLSQQPELQDDKVTRHRL